MAAAVLATQELEQEGVEPHFVLPERIRTRDARVFTERVLILTSLIKHMEKEAASLITDLKDYLNARGEDVLLTRGLGHVRLQTSHSRRLQANLLPPDVRAAATVHYEQHSLYRHPKSSLAIMAEFSVIDEFGRHMVRPPYYELDQEGAIRRAEQLLRLHSTITALERESKPLIEAVKAYMLRKGLTCFTASNGSVDLRTSHRTRLDQTLIPACMLEQARADCTTSALYKYPSDVQRAEGEQVGRSMVGGPLITLVDISGTPATVSVVSLEV